MKRLSFALFVALTVTSKYAQSVPGSWPRLADGTRGECTEALRIAEAAFNSAAPSLFALPAIPSGLSSKLVLGSLAPDISGGDALEVDADVFDKLPLRRDGVASRSAYWQRVATAGSRIVVIESPAGWRGDTYSLFAIPEKEPPQKALEELTDRDHAVGLAPIVWQSWRPPLVFQTKASEPAWIIDVGQPYQFLADWRVRIPTATGPKVECLVQFRPSVDHATSLLPGPVRQLARLLDQTMGPGNDEGTLQPTARLRGDAEHTWANAALRPWALDAPYNTRAEVDDGLESWSRKGPTYRSTYLAIQRQYPLAEQALAKYYQSHFHRSAEEARTLSAYALDIALRSHYAFHSDRPFSLRYGSAEPNPWRSR